MKTSLKTDRLSFFFFAQEKKSALTLHSKNMITDALSI